jgi:6,7-dimethyl-8-ribityllumazine synthase
MEENGTSPAFAGVLIPCALIQSPSLERVAMNQRHHDTTESPARIAFIQACWHKEIVDQARLAYVAAMERAGFPAGHIEVIEVPGSFEIPLQAQRAAASGRYAAIVAAGFVVDGGIYRHEFVARAVIDGMMRVQLDTGVPVLSVVLTPQHFHEHDAHQRFFHDHFAVKGAEAAAACLRVLDLMRPRAQAAA